jgi:hypothetical protein
MRRADPRQKESFERVRTVGLSIVLGIIFSSVPGVAYLVASSDGKDCYWAGFSRKFYKRASDALKGF